LAVFTAVRESPKERNTMTTKTKSQSSAENKNRLLNSEERDILSQIATNDPPHSWRAQALLAVDEGATQADAGRQAECTTGQVRYWLGKFRKDRTSIFPEELLNQARQGDADSPQGSAEPIASPEVQDLEQSRDEEKAQQEMLDAEETAGPADKAAAQQEDAPKTKKKSKQKPKKKSGQKPKKKSKKARKSKKAGKPKQDKKKKKGKKSTKKTKKKQPKKGKGAKGKSRTKNKSKKSKK
jgi:hypothetical protein